MAIDTKDYPNKIAVGLKANDDYDVFYYVFSHNKKKYRGLLDYRDKNFNKRERVKEATFKLMELKKAKERGAGDGRVRVDEYFYEFYALKKETTWKRTLVSHYERYVSPTFGMMRLQDVLKDDIERAIKVQESMGLKPRTIKQTIECLNPVFKNAIANRLIVYNPLDGVKVEVPSSKKIVANASHELKLVYDGIMKEFEGEPFYKAFYLFALQGRRKGEILTLETQDINLEYSYYILRDVKNGETQKMFLSEELKALLLEFVDFKKKWVFASPVTESHMVNVEKVTARLRKRIGSRFTLHYLRNVVVSAMAENGMDGVSMGASLGHNNVNTLRKYLTMPYEEGSRKASEVIERITKS